MFGTGFKPWQLKDHLRLFGENKKLVGSKWLRRICSLIPNGRAGHRVYPMPWESGPNIQFCRIWSEISSQIVFQVADSTKAGPLAVSDRHLWPYLSSLQCIAVCPVWSVCSVQCAVCATFSGVFFCCIGSIPAGWWIAQSLSDLGETPSRCALHTSTSPEIWQIFRKLENAGFKELPRNSFITFPSKIILQREDLKSWHENIDELSSSGESNWTRPSWDVGTRDMVAMFPKRAPMWVNKLF